MEVREFWAIYTLFSDLRPGLDRQKEQLMEPKARGIFPSEIQRMLWAHGYWTTHCFFFLVTDRILWAVSKLYWLWCLYFIKPSYM